MGDKEKKAEEIIEETITKEPKGDKFLFRLVVKYRIKVK